MIFLACARASWCGLLSYCRYHWQRSMAVDLFICHWQPPI